jgi:hypothetical protein
MNITNKSKALLKYLVVVTSTLGFSANYANAGVTLETEVKIADKGLHFNGADLNFGNVGTPNEEAETYDFFFGRNISAHGDAVKPYKNYVFMTWYRGGKQDRHVMLSRYNTTTGSVKTIEFPHRHTGFRGNPLVGESHNTIGLAVSPINGTIHMVYDMHAYDDNNHGGVFKDDFFRYSFSIAGAADLPDEEFTLDKFVKDTSAVSQGPDDYKHLTMTGNLADRGNFARLTYPQFFTTDDGTLLLYMRLGGNNNGAYIFNSYDAVAQKWSRFTKFNENNQRSKGNPYNWGLYGNMKYLNGKLRIGFQQRSSINTDRYQYQNGVYYAYSDHPQGNGDWKNHRDEPLSRTPLVNSDEIKVYEPGDFIEGHTEANSVHIVGSFDWTVTAKGDIHTISRVRSTDRTRSRDPSAGPERFQDVSIHAYKPAGATEFITTTDFSGASEIYTAGENIYIIGLNGGLPFVERAKGGTNNFERVYSADPEGRRFDHGTIYVADGKVYYYLMERPEGALQTTQPLYLQIIDLDLETEANAPQVSFPQSSMTVAEGFEQLTLGVTATSPVEGRTIQSVTLYLNGEVVRTDDSDPYLFGHGSRPHETGALGWREDHSTNPNPLPAGTHTFRAVATDSEGETGSAFMTLTVQSSAPIVSFPNPAVTVDVGYDRLGFTIDASSPEADRTIESVTLLINGEEVRTDTRAPFNFGHAFQPHETGALGWLDTHEPNPNPLGAGVHTFTAIATDSAGEQTTATMLLTVRGLPEPPTVSFPNETVEVTEGYERLGVTLPADSPVEGRTVVSVTLYRNGELVRVDTRAPWNFGHGFAPYELGAMGWLDRHEPNPNPLGVGTHTFRAVARDSEGLESETFMTLIVNPLPGPTVAFSESEIELAEGYTELSVAVDAAASSDDASIVSVELYLNDSLVREQLEAPFVWGTAENAAELLGLSQGTHTLKAVATDSNGKTEEASVMVEVTAAAILGDFDADGDVDSNDVRAFRAAVSGEGISDLAYDFNKDGTVSSRDLRGLTKLCTRSRCASE